MSLNHRLDAVEKLAGERLPLRTELRHLDMLAEARNLAPGYIKGIWQYTQPDHIPSPSPDVDRLNWYARVAATVVHVQANKPYYRFALTVDHLEVWIKTILIDQFSLELADRDDLTGYWRDVYLTRLARWDGLKHEPVDYRALLDRALENGTPVTCPIVGNYER